VGSAGTARRFVRATLEQWTGGGPEEAIGIVVLLTSEVVTNALLHAGLRPGQGNGDIRLDLRLDRLGLIRVEVGDPSPVLPVLGSGDTGAEGGLGLILVAALASAWGTRPAGTGKVVWFEVQTRRRRDQPRAAACVSPQGADPPRGVALSPLRLHPYAHCI
jgi:anti-sigma regulatory factor (Ser/Thr protein kinase)